MTSWWERRSFFFKIISCTSKLPPLRGPKPRTSDPQIFDSWDCRACATPLGKTSCADNTGVTSSGRPDISFPTLFCSKQWKNVKRGGWGGGSCRPVAKSHSECQSSWNSVSIKNIQSVKRGSFWMSASPRQLTPSLCHVYMHFFPRILLILATFWPQYTQFEVSLHAKYLFLISKMLATASFFIYVTGVLLYIPPFQWAAVKPNRVFTLLPLAVIMRQWESNQERFPLATLQCIFSHQSQGVLYGQHYNWLFILYVCEKREFMSLPSFLFFLTLSFFLYLTRPIPLSASRSVCFARGSALTSLLPSWNRGCRVWPSPRTAICTACPRRTAPQAAARGSDTPWPLWARPISRATGQN